MQHRTAVGPADGVCGYNESLMTAPAERKAANKRFSKTDRVKFCKQGCLMHFTVSQLAAWPEVTCIVGRAASSFNALA